MVAFISVLWVVSDRESINSTKHLFFPFQAIYEIKRNLWMFILLKVNNTMNVIVKSDLKFSIK